MSEGLGRSRTGRVRVLRIFSRLNIGGPSVHVILLSAGLAPWATRRGSSSDGSRRARATCCRLAAEKGVVCEAMAGLGREIAPLSDLRALFGLVRLLRAWRPTIVHTHTAKAGLLGRLAARAAGVPMVVHTYHGHVLRGYFSPAKTAFFRWLETRLASLADALVAVSESVKDDLVGLGVARAEKIRVIPLGLELAHLAGALPRGVLRREAGIPDGAPLVGMVGRLVPIKDVPTFLRAAATRARAATGRALRARGRRRGAARARGGSAAALGLDRAVTFFGWRRDLAAVYGDLDVVVNASRNEGTPVALIEALAAARPVVATRVGGTPDLLGDGERGTLVPPGEPEALARAVLRDARRVRGRARSRARPVGITCSTHHSSERLVRDVDALYRELLAAKKAA